MSEADVWPPHRFVLVRHAEASCNVLGPQDRIEVYDTDAGLTAHGCAQAHALACGLPADLVGPVIFSSPLRRAAQTAATVAQCHGAEVVHDGRLAEMLVNGRFTPPLPLDQWDAMLQERVAHPEHAVAAGVEPLAEQEMRVRDFLAERHARRGRASVTLIVAHAFTIELALLALLGLGLDALQNFRFRLSNAAVHVVENTRLGAPSRLLLVNAKHHLGSWL